MIYVQRRLAMSNRSVLVTGGAGYLGSVLVEELCHRGYQTIVFDSGLTSPNFIQRLHSNCATYIPGDIRDSDSLVSVLRRVDSVVHLAAIVGDPACNVDPDLAWEINYLSTIYMAEACRRESIRRFVFASSCSNYGLYTNKDVDEWAPLNPQSIYAQTKIQSEHYLLSVRDSKFYPCILRFATLYGLSPRMRFDLAINIMTIKALLEKDVIVYGGDQWRPFLHLRDAAQAIIHALETPVSNTASEIYNCGSDTENYRLKEIAELIIQEVPDTKLSVALDQSDRRSYRVNFGRIRQDLHFLCRYHVIDGIREIRSAVQGGLYHDFTEPQYNNYMLIDRAHAKRQELSILG
jgi:nucleoside-diphosphate-sugar epimerase